VVRETSGSVLILYAGGDGGYVLVHTWIEGL
jgi:hypothetical protein